jgi:polysaccharide deacetylase 2 family uncharacterized protein YibQ
MLTAPVEAGTNNRKASFEGKFMARKRFEIRNRWQLWGPAAALILGLGLLVMALRPDVPARRTVAAVNVPARALRDPLALGPEAVMPEALVPAETAPVVSLPVKPPAHVAPAVAAATPRPLVPAPRGEATWKHYAVRTGPEDSRPMIAIVIDDMGLDRRHSAEVVGLPGPLTLSFMSYAEDLRDQTAAARDNGHEIMLHVPMEPQAARVDAGPNALKLNLDEAEIKKRLDWDLGRIDGIVGINNHMGSRFTESIPGMTSVIGVLRERGLFFLDSRTTPHSVGMAVASELGVPHAGRDIFLDVDLTDPAVAAELAKTEAVARHNGFAIAIGHPHDPTITELRRWLPTVEARGFRLVPVSAIVQHNEVLAGHAARVGG